MKPGPTIGDTGTGMLLATSTGRTMFNGVDGVAHALRKTDKPVMLFCSIPYEAGPEGFDVIAAEKIPSTLEFTARAPCT